MLSIREALDLMLPSFGPVGEERVPLPAALGRVLARDLVARYDLPPFDNSAMDGYALRASDLAVAGCTLPLCDESRAGGGEPSALPEGHAMRIFTGAPMPAGADTVVMQEDTARPDGEPGRMVLNALPKPRANVRKRGSDLAAGAVALTRGRLLGPGEIGLLAGLDEALVDVFRRPRVAVLSTGDELREVGEPERPASIVNSNAYALAAAITQAGAEAVVLPVARDRMEEIAARVAAGLGADLLLSVGGVSVGDYDLVPRVLREAGVSLGFHKVAIKPGKPLLFGTCGKVPVVGLPGNPVSALVTFEVFVRPGIARMLGHARPFRCPLIAELDAPYEHGPGRTELSRAQLTYHRDRVVAQLHTRQGSGSLMSMASSDALVILPGSIARFESGARVSVLRLSDPPGSAASPFDD